MEGCEHVVLPGRNASEMKHAETEESCLRRADFPPQRASGEDDCGCETTREDEVIVHDDKREEVSLSFAGNILCVGLTCAATLPRSDFDAVPEAEGSFNTEVPVADSGRAGANVDQAKTCENHSDPSTGSSGVELSTEPVEFLCEQFLDETVSSAPDQNSVSGTDVTATELDNETDDEEAMLASQSARLLESTGVTQFQGHDTEAAISSDDQSNESSPGSPSPELLHCDAVVHLQEPDEDEWSDKISGYNLWPGQHWMLVLHDGLTPPEDEEESSLGSDSSIGECHICFELTRVKQRSCCNFQVCSGCFVTYLTSKVSEGTTSIQCPNTECSSRISEYEIATRMPSLEMERKFRKFLVDANNDRTMKTCPRCGETHRVDKSSLKKKKVAKKGLRVACRACALEWCFTCHAPWHEWVTCKVYRGGHVGEEQLRAWAGRRDTLHNNQFNAQRCPGCKAYFQRTAGCPHMECRLCGTHFCYDCGQRIFDTGDVSVVSRFLLGSHNSRLSPRGCRTLFLPKSGAFRKLIRGSILGVKVVGGVALVSVVAAVALGVAVVALPVWGSRKVARRIGHRISARRGFQLGKPHEDVVEAMPGVYRKVCNG